MKIFRVVTTYQKTKPTEAKQLIQSTTIARYSDQRWETTPREKARAEKTKRRFLLPRENRWIHKISKIWRLWSKRGWWRNYKRWSKQARLRVWAWPIWRRVTCPFWIRQARLKTKTLLMTRPNRPNFKRQMAPKILTATAWNATWRSSLSTKTRNLRYQALHTATTLARWAWRNNCNRRTNKWATQSMTLAKSRNDKKKQICSEPATGWPRKKWRSWRICWCRIRGRNITSFNWWRARSIPSTTHWRIRCLLIGKANMLNSESPKRRSSPMRIRMRTSSTGLRLRHSWWGRNFKPWKAWSTSSLVMSPSSAKSRLTKKRSNQAMHLLIWSSKLRIWVNSRHNANPPNPIKRWRSSWIHLAKDYWPCWTRRRLSL